MMPSGGRAPTRSRTSAGGARRAPAGTLEGSGVSVQAHAPAAQPGDFQPPGLACGRVARPRSCKHRPARLPASRRACAQPQPRRADPGDLEIWAPPRSRDRGCALQRGGFPGGAPQSRDRGLSASLFLGDRRWKDGRSPAEAESSAAPPRKQGPPHEWTAHFGLRVPESAMQCFGRDPRAPTSRDNGAVGGAGALTSSTNGGESFLFAGFFILGALKWVLDDTLACAPIVLPSLNTMNTNTIKV
ncbi:unnamed protein product [Prorocentrum cordatum]|uniref:Mitochondrial fission process protein 1 n=1 Tax=Prorocentrum cordatum TaxID=2364126 RepID=A0ABN9WPS5_9DINO|nr:unnamed protein product [Polarella glacialis]